jgi:hypothetical protein
MRIAIGLAPRLAPEFRGTRWTLALVTSALAFAQAPVASAAEATGQTLISAHVVGTAMIRGGPAGPSALSSPEIRGGDDDQSVKAQAPGSAPSLRTATSLRTLMHARYGRYSNLPIPRRCSGDGNSQGGGSSSGLRPPPTSNPNPAGRNVKDASGSTFGWNGLTHFDQRTAGTGAYLNTQFSTEPPDQGLCAGNGFVVEVINTAIEVYDTSGNSLTGAVSLSQFMGVAPEIDRVTGITGPFIGDPRCTYDRKSGHWFVTTFDEDFGTNAGATDRYYNMMAISKTADPRGEWVVITYDVTDDGLNGTPNHAGCPCFGDQPLLGFDKYGVYQSTNEFGATAFNGAQVYALPKDALIAAAHGSLAPIPVVAINAGALPAPSGGTWYSIQPATSYGSGDDQDGNSQGGNWGGSSGTEFFLSALQFGVPPYAVLDNRIAVWGLTNTSSLSSATPRLNLSFQVIASETYGQPNPAQQKPGPTPLGTSLGESLELINTNDDRMNQVVYANGLLYSGVNTIIGDGTRTGIAWFAVAPGVARGNVFGAVAAQGYVAVDGENVIYPSIGVSGDTGVLCFSLVGPDYFPSAGYVTLGGSGPVRIVADGAAPDDGFTGYVAEGGDGVGRWGDYSAAVTDGNNIWFANEYIPNSPRTVLANWGTWIGKVRGDD